MADLNKDGLDDVTGLPVNPHTDISSPIIKKPTVKPDAPQETDVGRAVEMEKLGKDLKEEAARQGKLVDEPKKKSWLEREAERFENPATGAELPNPSEEALVTTKKPTTETATETATETKPTTETETATETPSNAESNYKLHSIMDAYNEGLIDDKTRDYMIVDTLSKFARSLGKDVSNAGAAFSGGAIQDSTPEQTLWQARNNEMAKQGITSEANQVAGSDREQNYRSNEATIESKQLANAKERIKQTPAQNFISDANKLRAMAANETDPSKKTGYEMQARLLELVAAGATEEVGMEEYFASVLAADPSVHQLVNNITTAGAATTSTINDIMEWISSFKK